MGTVLTGMLPLLLLLPRLGPSLVQGSCCDVRNGEDYENDLNGLYMLAEAPTADLDGVCVDNCIYKKVAGGDEEYCFKNNDKVDGDSECKALPTEDPDTGSTVAPDVLENKIGDDENEVRSLEEEEADAEAVDNEIDGVADKIDELTGGGGGRLNRNRRQDSETTVAPAETCTEIATLVGEMERETRTKNKLIIIRRITQTKILSCTDEEGKQQLIGVKVTIKAKIRDIRKKVKDRVKVIKDTKLTLQLKIVSNQKRLCKMLAKQDIYNKRCPKPRPRPTRPVEPRPTRPVEPTGNPTKPPRPTNPTKPRPTGSEQITGEPTKEKPITIDPTGETPIPIEPTGETPVSMDPTGETPITIDPTGETPITMEPSGETPITMEPTGEKPITIDPNGEKPITIDPNGETPIVITPTGERPIPILPNGEMPIDINKYFST